MTKLCQNVTTIFIFCNLNFFLKFFCLSQHFFSTGFSPFCALFAIFFQFFLVYGRYLKFFLWYLNFYLGGRKSSREWGREMVLDVIRCQRAIWNSLKTGAEYDWGGSNYEIKYFFYFYNPWKRKDIAGQDVQTHCVQRVISIPPHHDTKFACSFYFYSQSIWLGLIHLTPVRIYSL